MIGVLAGVLFGYHFPLISLVKLTASVDITLSCYLPLIANQLLIFFDSALGNKLLHSLI